jgi:hypothetical protein
VESGVERAARVLRPELTESKLKQTAVHMVLEDVERRDSIIECRMPDVGFVRQGRRPVRHENP